MSFFTLLSKTINPLSGCNNLGSGIFCAHLADEVIVPAYTYTASASVVEHVGAKIVFVDIQRDCLEMDYDAVEAAINERTKAIVPVDLGGVPCDYERIFQIVEQKRGLFRPSNELQRRIGRIVISADCAHAFGSWRYCEDKKGSSLI